MVEESQVDQILDEWEELLERNAQADVNEFVEQHVSHLKDEEIEVLRKRAVALARMNKRIAALQDTDDLPPDTSRVESVRGKLGYLEPGYEPLDGYKLVERLGEGGFGEVWKATDAQGFSVAIKFVKLDGSFGEKELRSLDVIKDVRHPHLLTIFKTRQVDGVLVIAMELADRTLMSRLEEAQKEGYEGIPRDELLEYMAEAAKGIDFLNDPGSSGRPRIQHRDIKPQNLLLSGNSVKIADYSLAQSLKFNVADSTGSTPAYAAPEFFDGNTSSQSDQYSLAVTYCLLRGGRLPFEGSLTDLMEAHRNADPDLSMLPVEERPAVIRALAKKPKDRWASCAEFVSALKGNSEDQSVAGLLKALPRKTKIIAGAMASLLAVLLLLFVSGFFGGGNDEQPPSTGQQTAHSENRHAENQELTVAVLDFANHSKDPALEGYRLGFRDMLTTDLSKLSSIKVLERARLDALLQEHDLARTDFIDADTAVRLRKGLSAHAMLSGSYVISGDDIRVDVRLVSVETGEVIQAEAVEGKKSDMFGLQKSLAAKVLSGLDVAPTESEQEALNQPQTREFDAFRLYSEARLAQQQGKREEAKKRFNEALQLDPEFALAARELDRLETEALFRLSESQQQKVNSAGEIGKRLQEHWNTHQRIVEQDRRDAEYFASTIVLAAHAGLYGDYDQERQLLITFWKRFSESVPPQKAVAVAKEIRRAVAKESEFFQKTVDSGDYGIMLSGIGGMTPTKKYLKPELRGHFVWPKWSVVWPFAEDARTAFGQAEIAPMPTVADSWKSSFEDDLPADAHDYLEEVLDYGVILEDQRVNPARFSEALRIYLSILRYYGRLNDWPESLAKELSDIQSRSLSLLARVEVSEVEQNLLQDAIPVLEAIAKTQSDVEKRERADQLLVRFVRQAKINEGIAESHATGPAKLYGMPLDGLPIQVVWDVGRLGGVDFARARIEDHVRESLGDSLRALPSDTEFNFLWSGHINEEEANPLFERPQVADASAKQKGLGWLGKKAHGSIEETQSLGMVIERLTRDGNEKGLVIVVALNDDLTLPQSTIDFVLRAKSRPRFNVIATKKQQQLAQLAAASNGSAVLLRAEGGFLGNDDINVEPWDVSVDRPEQSTSSVTPVEPIDVTTEDFECDTRIEDQRIRDHLLAAIDQHLSSLNPQEVSTTRYFTSLALLAQIAGRIGHRPLEDALTRKWWAEIEPLADSAAALRYEQTRKTTRSRSTANQPLLLELKELLQKESKELWFKPRIDGLFDLPKPKLAPSSEPYIWASPIFWLRGMSEYREEMGSDLNVSLLKYHIGASTDFNSEFVSSASVSWMHDLVKYRGGVQSGRFGTAIQTADLALGLCESIPISDRRRQKWLIQATQDILKTKQEILRENENPVDWVAASEYAPKRPWRGIEPSASTFPLFGRTLKTTKGLVVICDMSVSDARHRSDALNGLLLAVSEAGDGVEIRCILSGRKNETWPNSGLALLDADGKNRFSKWLKERDQGAPDTHGGDFSEAIKEALMVENTTGDPPSAILVVCQKTELAEFDPVGLASDIPIHTFAIPRLGSSRWSDQRTQIEKMRVLADKSAGQFTVVSDDWIWLYGKSQP